MSAECGCPATRDMTRFTAIGRHAAGIDPTGERELKFIDTMVAHNTVLDGTVNIFEGFFEARSGEVHPGYKNVADRLPPQVRRGLLLGGLRPPVGDEDHYQRAFASMLRFLAAVHEAGVPIIPGTDGLAGFALQRELELYAAAGIPIADVLRMATLGSAEANRKAHELGVIAPGWLADLIVIEGDPLTDISDIRQVRQIMKDGLQQGYFKASSIWRLNPNTLVAIGTPGFGSDMTYPVLIQFSKESAK